MDLETDLLLTAEDDYLGLWEVVAKIRRELGEDAPADEVRRRTLQVLKSMMEKGLLVVGTFPPGPPGLRFKRWNLSVEASIERIASEWHALGTDPSIADIASFDTPDHVALLESEQKNLH